MNVNLKIHCKELVKGLREGDYTLPNGASVNDALKKAQQEAGVTLTAGSKNSIVFLLNGRPAELDARLTDGDKLRVLQKILGG